VESAYQSGLAVAEAIGVNHQSERSTFPIEP
jgi:hypothetical protein